MIRRLAISVCLASSMAWTACGPATEETPSPRSVETGSVHPCVSPEFNNGWPSRTVPFDADIAAGEEPAAVEGWVFDLTGNPLSPVVVSLMPADSGRDGGGDFTDADGSFHLAEMSPGVALLEFRAGGFLPQTQAVQLLPGRTDTLCVVLRARAMAQPALGPGG